MQHSRVKSQDHLTKLLRYKARVYDREARPLSIREDESGDEEEPFAIEDMAGQYDDDEDDDDDDDDDGDNDYDSAEDDDSLIYLKICLAGDPCNDRGQLRSGLCRRLQRTSIRPNIRAQVSLLAQDGHFNDLKRGGCNDHG